MRPGSSNQTPSPTQELADVDVEMETVKAKKKTIADNRVGKRKSGRPRNIEKNKPGLQKITELLGKERAAHTPLRRDIHKASALNSQNWSEEMETPDEK